MSDLAENRLSICNSLETASVGLKHVACDGACRRRSQTEYATETHLVYPYHGAFLRHVGSNDALGDAHRLLIFNENQEYQISHPISGGDECLSMMVDPAVLHEICPGDQLAKGSRATFRHYSRRIGAHSQALVAFLVHGLRKQLVDALEAEILALTLVRRSFEDDDPAPARSTIGRRKLAERAKLTLMEGLGRRWTLAEVAAEVGVSPVYLAQVFSQVEGVPLHRYHRQLRLARALNLLPDCEDLTGLALDLGFSSHSHFTYAFRKQFGTSPSSFQKSVDRARAA